MSCIHCSEMLSQIPLSKLDAESLFKFHSSISDLYGINNVIITGGEPTLHDSFYEIIERLLHTGNIVLITTNALALDQEKTKKLLKKYPNMRLQISMDGTDEATYEKVRGKNTWKPFFDMLSGFMNNTISSQVGLSMTILKFNQHQVFEMISFAEKAKFGFVHFPVLLCAGATKKRWSEVAPCVDDQIKIETELFSFISEYTGDLNISSNRLEQIITAIESNGVNNCRQSPTLKIAANGEIYPCPAASASSRSIGSIYTHGIVESVFEKLNVSENTRTIYNNQCDQCDVNQLCTSQFCANCNMLNPDSDEAFLYTCKILKNHYQDAAKELAIL